MDTYKNARLTPKGREFGDGGPLFEVRPRFGATPLVDHPNATAPRKPKHWIEKAPAGQAVFLMILVPGRISPFLRCTNPPWVSAVQDGIRRACSTLKFRSNSTFSGGRNRS
jgi:hypothetical protein